MILAYISGPYRSASLEGVMDNIAVARKVALKYWKAGYAVICPHLNTALMDGQCADHVWLDGDIEMLKRCDVIVMLPKWKSSVGAKIERDAAIEAGLAVIYEQEGACAEKEKQTTGS